VLKLIVNELQRRTLMLTELHGRYTERSVGNRTLCMN